MLKLHTVFKIIGYEMETAEGTFFKSCVFWIYADNEEQAIKKAKSYKVQKKFYQVLEVIEKSEELDAAS